LSIDRPAGRLAIDGGTPVRATFLPFHQPSMGPEEEAEVLDTCAGIAANAPLTMRTAKRIVRELLKAPASFDEAACKDFVRECFDSDDYKEGRRAFMEKRTPAFKGR